MGGLFVGRGCCWEGLEGVVVVAVVVAVVDVVVVAVVVGFVVVGVDVDSTYRAKPSTEGPLSLQTLLS
jgi:hypothetical protein